MKKTNAQITKEIMLAAKKKHDFIVKMENVIFCSSCQYFIKEISACGHGENVTFEDTWFERSMIFKIHPSERNKNNDCKFFKKIAKP